MDMDMDLDTGLRLFILGIVVYIHGQTKGLKNGSSKVVLMVTRSKPGILDRE